MVTLFIASFDNPPVPVTRLVKSRSSLRLMARVPLLVMVPCAMLPAVPPLPSCKVPPAISKLPLPMPLSVVLATVKVPP